MVAFLAGPTVRDCIPGVAPVSTNERGSWHAITEETAVATLTPRRAVVGSPRSRLRWSRSPRSPRPRFPFEVLPSS